MRVIKTTSVEIAKHIIDHVSIPISFLSSQNIIADLKGPNVKYNLHYGWYTGRLSRAATRNNTSCSDNNAQFKFRSFKSKRNIHTNEDGSDCTVSNNNMIPPYVFNLFQRRSEGIINPTLRPVSNENCVTPRSNLGMFLSFGKAFFVKSRVLLHLIALRIMHYNG